MGVVFAGASDEMFGAAMGALAGYMLAELIALRRRAESLEQEVQRLQKAGQVKPVERAALRPAAESFENDLAADRRQSREGDERAVQESQRPGATAYTP